MAGDNFIFSNVKGKCGSAEENKPRIWINTTTFHHRPESRIFRRYNNFTTSFAHFLVNQSRRNVKFVKFLLYRVSQSLYPNQKTPPAVRANVFLQNFTPTFLIFFRFEHDIENSNGKKLNTASGTRIKRFPLTLALFELRRKKTSPLPAHH